MKQVFVDTNILLDYLFERRGFYKNAERLFDYCAMRNIKVNISSLSVATIAYLLSKKFRINEVKEQLEILYGFANILPFNKRIIFLAHQSSFKDLEDAFQYFTAKEHHIPLLITRNIKDFAVDDLSPTVLRNHGKINQVPHKLHYDKILLFRNSTSFCN